MRFSDTAPNTSAQLMQLRKPEAFSVFDNHQCGIGHVDANLNNGCGNKHVDVALGKLLHNGILLLAFHTPVQKGYTHLGKCFLQFLCKGDRRFEGRLFLAREEDFVEVAERDLFGFFFLFFDCGANDVNLSALVDLLLNERIESRTVGLVYHKGIHSLPACGHFVNAGNIELPIQNKRE